MPPRDLTIRIRDILDATRKIKTYTDNMSFEEFEQDEKTVDAVIRNFTVIGEAAARVPLVVKKKHSKVPWVQMVGMRNIVVHEYFGISLAIIWATARNRLPELEVSLAAIYKQLSRTKPTPKSVLSKAKKK